MPEEWNGWKVGLIFNWYVARKPGQRTKWIWCEEVPRNDGAHGQERHLLSWLNLELPVSRRAE